MLSFVIIQLQDRSIRLYHSSGGRGFTSLAECLQASDSFLAGQEMFVCKAVVSAWHKPVSLVHAVGQSVHC